MKVKVESSSATCNENVQTWKDIIGILLISVMGVLFVVCVKWCVLNIMLFLEILLFTLISFVALLVSRYMRGIKKFYQFRVSRLLVFVGSTMVCLFVYLHVGQG